MRIFLMKQLADAFGEEPFTAKMASEVIKKDQSYIQRQLYPYIKKKMIGRIGKSTLGVMQYSVTRKWFVENAPEKVEKKQNSVNTKTVGIEKKEVRVLDNPIGLNESNLNYYYNEVGCSVPEIAHLAKKGKDHVYKAMKDKGIKIRSTKDTALIKKARTVEYRLKTDSEIPTKDSTKDSISITRLEAVERILGKRFNEWKEKVVDDAAVELIRRLIDG